MAFFMPKAGLPQATLGRIWELGTNGAAYLDQGSFRRVCQLIWYAQHHGNDLPADARGIVMKIISGMATLPPPKLAGLDVAPTLQTMQPVGIPMPPPPQPAYSVPPTGYSTASSQALPAVPTPSYPGYPRALFSSI